MKRPWMPLYIADYLKDTSNLRALESGAYLHLIMAYWTNGTLPNDDRQLATIAKTTDQEWEWVKKVLAPYFGPEWATHKRIDAELAKMDELSSKRRANALQRASKKGAKPHTLHTSHFTEEKIEGACAPPPVKKDRRQATQIPEDLTANRAAQEAAGLSVAEGLREFAKFRNHAKERGRTCVDWAAAERNWYLKAAEFMGRKPAVDGHDGPAIPNEFAVKLFQATGRWNRAFGPEPGKPGCRAPAEVLANYGYGYHAPTWVRGGGAVKGRPRKKNVRRSRSGKSLGEKMGINPETIAVRERELIADGVNAESATDALSSSTLGRLLLRHRQDPSNPASITQEQYDVGDAWLRLVYRHAAIMGYKIHVRTPSFVMVGGFSEDCRTPPSAERIAAIRGAYRDCWNALGAACAEHKTSRIMTVISGVCIENWPAASLTTADYGWLRVGLNAIGRALSTRGSMWP